MTLPMLHVVYLLLSMPLVDIVIERLAARHQQVHHGDC